MAEQVPMIEVRRASKVFGTVRSSALGQWAERAGLVSRQRAVQALDCIDLSITRGEVVGLVGESGCGKSTLGRIIADQLQPSRGEVRLEGVPREQLGAEQAKAWRLRVQMIFQDASASLNPRLRVDRSVGEGALVNGLVEAAGLDDYVALQLQRAGLNPALRRRYPHQFSGGQRQRIGIARALAVQPQLLVCDESVAALDVSVQAQVLNLFMDLREQLGLTYLFISHDLGVVEHICDRVVVMYLGRIVESAPVEALFRQPNHPYTQGLLAQVPRFSARRTQYNAIEGDIPSPLAPPSGCHFHPRCPYATARCREEVPTLREVAPGHHSACHLND